jgi:hypothetical protein
LVLVALKILLAEILFFQRLLQMAEEMAREVEQLPEGVGVLAEAVTEYLHSLLALAILR